MDVGEDDRVLIMGSGISGILHIQLAKSLGAKEIIATDVSDYRLKMARKFGADKVFDARKFSPSDNLSDKVIVSTGAESAAIQALKTVDRGGTILYFAVPQPGIDINVPINDFWRNEITISTSYGAGPIDLQESLELIINGKINAHDMITHKLVMDEIGLGFNLVAEADKSLKVVIEPNS